MSVGFCGRSCEFEDCALRADLNCPGCQMGPGNAIYGDCAIAACCRAEKAETCESCPKRVGCTETAVRDLMAQRRKTSYEAKIAKSAVMARRGPFLKKLFWALFWLTILRSLDLYTIFDEGESMYRVFQCLNDVVRFGMAMVLVGMAQEERSYLAPGCVMGGLAVYDFLLHLMTVNGAEPAWAVLSVLVIPCVEICMTWLLMTAHAGTAPDVDTALGEKWQKLRKWYLICMLSLEATNYIYIILPTVVLLASTVLAVTYLVLEVIHLVYLYRMAKGYSQLCSGK